MDVYKGDKYDDTAITEIYFDGLDVHCFAVGTKILMANRTEKNIEQIQQGNSIITFDTETNRISTSQVTQLVTIQHSNLAKLTFADREVVVTDDHPFYIKSKEWASFNPDKSNDSYHQDKPVLRLSVGDSIFNPTENKYLRLDNIEYLDGNQLTYTIELESGNNFTANGLLVKTENVKQDLGTHVSVIPQKQLIEENYREVIGDDIKGNRPKPDKYAMYPNGLDGVLQHIVKETRYPMDAQIRKAQGKVLVKLIIDVDGTVQNVEVIKRVDKELDAEAVRVLKKMQIWEPAYKNGKPVKAEYTFPITFRL